MVLESYVPGMSAWKTVSRSIIAVYLEFLDTIHPFQLGESEQWDFGCPGDKLHELGTVSLVEGTQRSPKPLDL